MKKRKLLFAFLFSLMLIISACGDSGGDSDTNTNDMKETVVDENAVESSKDKNSEAKVEETNSSNWFEQTKNMEVYYYEVKTELADGSSFLTKVWVSENKTKTESSYSDTGEEIIMIMDGEENLSYLYMPAENTAIKMELDNFENFAGEDEQQGAQDYIEILKDLADDETIVTEKGQLDGEPVTIVTSEIDKNKNKVWISEKNGFPLKSEFYMDGSLESTSTFEKFEEGSIDPSTFTLPEGVEVQDMTNY